MSPMHPLHSARPRVRPACAGKPRRSARPTPRPPAFPTSPITVVVPFPAGGPTDASARLFARTMGESLGQPIVVDNRAGAAGTVGSAWVARATADGYTLLWGGTSTLAVAPKLYKNLKYDAKSFIPIGMALRGPLMLAGRPGRRPTRCPSC
jgi:tripartite-type tricarboxylate transporter receptor subunit TctC